MLAIFVYYVSMYTSETYKHVLDEKMPSKNHTLSTSAGIAEEDYFEYGSKHEWNSC